MGLIDNFRNLKALIILFLLFVCMNYVPNKNRKDFKVKQASFNSDYVKKSIETSTLFQNDPPTFESSSKISPHFSGTFSHPIKSITNSSVG